MFARHGAHDATMSGWPSQPSTHRFGGRYVQSTGDGLLGCLPTPDAAVECSRALVEELRGVGVEIRFAGTRSLKGVPGNWPLYTVT